MEAFADIGEQREEAWKPHPGDKRKREAIPNQHIVDKLANDGPGG